MRFAERFCEAIKHSGLTQKQLAQRLNISEGNITNWKKGQNLPSVEILCQLCIILDESADYLLGLDEKSPNVKQVSYRNSTHVGDNNFSK